ncbi:MAG: type II toxin-antitoxin system HicB family antitoxin [Candidatus Poribacteria bacterium]|nr:type II toxin-antitoxin system HicB family antitoxin [Candidatus Poribacteria bacterium]
MKIETFTASVWQEDDWFIAQCLEVDVASQGGSEAEALVNLGEALELHFEPPRSNLKPIPRYK